MMAEAAALGAEVRVGGERIPLVPPARVCRHEAGLLLDPVVGLLHDSPDPDVVTGWEVRVRAMCQECGQRFQTDPASARPERDPSGLGVVFTCRPAGL